MLSFFSRGSSKGSAGTGYSYPDLVAGTLVVDAVVVGFRVVEVLVVLGVIVVGLGVVVFGFKVVVVAFVEVDLIVVVEGFSVVAFVGAEVVPSSNFTDGVG